MTSWTVHDPLWLLALLLLPALAALRARRRAPVLVVPFAASWYKPTPSAFASWPAVCTYAGIALLIVGMARPQTVDKRQESNQKGYDIILAIDLSTSMYAEDFQRAGKRINRLQAVKPVLEAFINDRPADRIGLVVFAGRAYTFAPLTFDHDWLRRQTARLKIGLIEGNTAIGDALGVALSRLEQGGQDAAARNREGAFIVLLTDGANNAGALDPRQSADLARQRGITVYTIGAGRDGYVPVPRFDTAGNIVTYERRMSDLDEPLLREIAADTGGAFFRADDSDTIESAFAAINRAEKIEFETRSFVLTDEIYPRAVIPGLVFLGLASRGVVQRRQREVAA
jgi:Ca-activated chloride channel family protein